ncbi:PAS domain-containing protein [Haloplanus litoreus]|uniref:histidine kinase n=3 Tax=Haloplanus litoreus TaxID=767515 RepID=A0ABD5ZUJ3_9EURY
MTDSEEIDQYRRLVEESNDVVAVVDTDGTVTYVSPAVKRVLGYDPEALVGDVGSEYTHPDDRDTVTAAVESLRTGPDEPRTVEFRVQRADGSWCWIEATMRNRLDDDVIAGIL